LLVARLAAAQAALEEKQAGGEMKDLLRTGGSSTQ
jgi:hypothetical protein